MGKIITLTTDFGTRDPYVGAMKGVILSICPGAQVVDITHEVGRHDILEGALALASACDYFPKGTVHLAVVDPGVGTKRKAVAVRVLNQSSGQAEEHCFVGPDNGVLSLALQGRKRSRAVEIKNPKAMLKEVSATFHGRDIFAPAAAYLAKGKPLSFLGPPVKVLRKIALPGVRQTREATEGEVIAFDRFGNAITNISRQEAGGGRQRATKTIRVMGRTIGLEDAYGDVEPGEAAALWGSHGFLEIAVNQGSAQEALGLTKGTRVSLKERIK
jgi:S-adenosylmethionine hydrolase